MGKVLTFSILRKHVTLVDVPIIVMFELADFHHGVTKLRVLDPIDDYFEAVVAAVPRRRDIDLEEDNKLKL